MQSATAIRVRLRFVPKALPFLSTLWWSSPHSVVRSAASFPQPLPKKDVFQDAALFHFRVLKTESELSAVVERLGERMSRQHVVAALTRLSQLGTPPHKTTLEILSTKAILLTPTMSARDAITLLIACRYLAGVNASLTQSLARRLICRESLMQLNGPLMARALTALVSLQLSPQSSPAANGHSKALPSVLLFEVLQEMSQLFTAEGFAERLSTNALVDIVSAFGTLRFQSPPLHQTISREITRASRLAAMRFRELAAVWRALADLQMTDKQALETLSQELSHQDRLEGFKAGELVSLLMASKQLLPFRNWSSLEKLIQECIKPDRLHAFTEPQLVYIVLCLKGFQIQDETVIAALLEEITKPHRLPFFTPHCIASLMSSLNALGYGSHPKVTPLIAGADYSQQKRSGTVKQTASLSFDPSSSGLEERLSCEWMKQVLTTEQLESLSDGLLLQLLSGIHHQVALNEAQKQLCVNAVVERLRNGSPHLLSHYAYGLNQHQIQSPEILTVLANEAVTEQTLKHFEACQLAGVLYALSSLGWKGSSIYDALFAEMCQTGRLSVLSEKGLARVIAAVQLSGRSFDGTTVEILHEATRPYRLSKFTEQSLISIVTSIGGMRFQGRPWTRCIYNEVTRVDRLARLTSSDLAQLICLLPQMKEKSSQGIIRIKHEVMQPHRLRQLKHGELCQLVYGLGGMRVRESDLSLAIANHITTSVDETALSNPEITNLIQGLSDMQCRHSACLDMLLKEATRSERLENYTSSEFTSVIYAVGQLSISDSLYLKPLLGVMDQTERLAALTDQHLVQVFVATSLLLSSPESHIPFPEALLQAVSQSERLCGLSARHFVRLTGVLGRHPFRQHYPGFVAALTAQLCRNDRLATLSPPELAQISQSLARAGLEEHPAVDCIAEELMARLLKETGI